MIFTDSIKRHFIFLIFLFIFIPKCLEASWDQVNQGGHEKSYSKLKDDFTGIKVEIPFDIFSVQSVKILPPSVTMKVKGTEIDLSSVMTGLEQVTQSFDDNLPQIDAVFSYIRSSWKKMCEEEDSLKDAPVCNKKTLINKVSASLSKSRNYIDEKMSDRILYSQGYNRDKSYANYFFQEAISLLDSVCTQTCLDWNIIKAIRFVSQNKYHQLYNKIKHKSKNCQRSILEAFAGSLRDEEFPKACLQEKNKNYPVCKTMLKDTKIVRNRFNSLVALVYRPEVLQATEAQISCLDCIPKPSDNKKLNEVLDILDEQSQCLDLNPGEEKTIHSGTGLNRSYAVKKEANGSYVVPLTVQFSPDRDYDGPVPKDHVPDYYMTKARDCMSQANVKMIGPKGERLKIVINSPTEDKSACADSNTEQILIGSSDHRDNSNKYGSDIDCSTITHEVLHLLGLCDEYQEKRKGLYVHSETGDIRPASQMNAIQEDKLLTKGYKFLFDYDCRVTTSNSIMSDQDEKWQNIFGVSGKKGKDADSKGFLHVSGNSGDSLLTPEQFNGILYGGCSKKNKTFNECSQLAYQNSESNKDCINKKRQCELQKAMGKE